MEFNNGTATIANRVAVWLAMAGLMAYALAAGSWKGRAEEQLKDAASVEATQIQLVERVTRMEEAVSHNTDAISDMSDEVGEVHDDVEELDRKAISLSAKLDEILRAIEDE